MRSVKGLHACVNILANSSATGDPFATSFRKGLGNVSGPTHCIFCIFACRLEASPVAGSLAGALKGRKPVVILYGRADIVASNCCRRRKKYLSASSMWLLPCSLPMAGKLHVVESISPAFD